MKILLLAAMLLQAPLSVREWRVAHEHEILNEFAGLLRLPNVSRNLSDIRANATLIEDMYRKRGIVLQRLEVPGGAPALFGEFKVPGATKTVVFYAHYDGQPVDAAQWINQAPFTPELRDSSKKLVPWPTAGVKIDPEWRLYARSAGDDKAPIMAFLVALDALKAAGQTPGVNIKFFFDGEEEINWPHLPQILNTYKSLLTSDGWLLFDGPMHQSRQQQIMFGARTQLVVNLTLYGAKNELHAGHYGNWAPNPALMLAQLVASMKDENGRVRIRGFYDDVAPLSATERAALRDVPNVDTLIQDQFSIGGTEVPGRRIEEAITQPSLTVLSLSAGGAGSVVPASATTAFRIDMVKGMDPAKTLTQLKAHVRGRGYTVIDHAPTDAERRSTPKLVFISSSGEERAERTSMDSPFAKQVIAAIESARGPVLKLPNMGAGLPVGAIHQALGAPAIIVPIANHDNNQHSHDENLRLQNLWDGIETIYALMRMK